MMRITTDESRQPPLLKLEGNFSGPWVMEVAGTWDKLKQGNRDDPVILDLSGLTFVDNEGKTLLQRMFHEGAEFRAAHGLTKYMVEKIQQESDSSRK